MYKLLKFTLITCIALTFIITGSMVYVINIVDPNIYKPFISQFVKEKLQRTLMLDGDIQLSFYPKIGVELNQLTLSEYKHDEIFATIPHAHLSLSLLPLFKQQFIADEVIISGLAAQLVRFEDGSMNIDDLISHEEETALNKLAIGRIRLANTTLTYYDEIGNSKYILSDLDLETNQVTLETLSHLKLKARAQKTAPDAVDKHFLCIELNVAGIQLRNNRIIVADTIDLLVKNINPAHHIIGKLSLPGIRSDKNYFETDLMTVEIISEHVAQTTRVSIHAPMFGKQNKEEIILPNLVAHFSILRPRLPEPHLNGKLTGKLTVNTQTESLKMNITGNMESTHFNAMIAMIDFTDPAFNFNIELDQLVLDRFLPQIQNKVSTKEKEEKIEYDENQTEPFDFSFLEKLQASGLVHIGILQYGEIHSSDVQLEIQTDNHKSDLIH